MDNVLNAIKDNDGEEALARLLPDDPIIVYRERLTSKRLDSTVEMAIKEFKPPKPYLFRHRNSVIDLFLEASLQPMLLSGLPQTAKPRQSQKSTANGTALRAPSYARSSGKKPIQLSSSSSSSMSAGVLKNGE